MRTPIPIDWDRSGENFTHYPSNAHEVLGTAEGKVTLRLGGEAGLPFHLKAGDMIVLPAGVGHRCVGGDAGLKVIGADGPPMLAWHVQGKH